MANTNFETKDGGINALVVRLFGLAVLTVFVLHQYLGILSQFEWLSYIDWLAFPTFAFLLAEGFDKTSSKVRYFIRFLLFALIAEVPYNLLHGNILFPKAQNGMLTLCAGFVVIAIINFVHDKFQNVVIDILLIYFLSKYTFYALDKFGFEFASFGMMFVVTFYVSNHVTYKKLLQALIFVTIVIYVASDYYLAVIIGNYEYSASFRAFCLIPMVLSWIYNGKRGPNVKVMNIFFYSCYPLLLTGVWAYEQFILK